MYCRIKRGLHECHRITLLGVGVDNEVVGGTLTAIVWDPDTITMASETSVILSIRLKSGPGCEDQRGEKEAEVCFYLVLLGRSESICRMHAY